MSDNKILSTWNDMKELLQNLDLDMHKNAAGNSAAGVRARKGLRALKKMSSELVKLSVEFDKSKKETK